MTPLFSIITINYNNDSELIKTVNSVFSQEFSNFEYIIIDGGSTDKSVDYIESIKHQLKYTISEKDSGIYHAMNKGWKEASGKYCLFLNSGDYLANKDVLAHVSKYVDQGLSDIYYGHLKAFTEKKEWISEFNEPLSLYYFHHGFLPHPSIFFSRKVLVEIGGYLESYKLISDWIFCIQAFSNGYSFQQIPFVISSFNTVGASNNGQLAQAERIKVFESELLYLKNDFEHFERLRHFDTSWITRLARKLSTFKNQKLSANVFFKE